MIHGLVIGVGQCDKVCDHLTLGGLPPLHTHYYVVGLSHGLDGGFDDDLLIERHWICADGSEPGPSTRTTSVWASTVMWLLEQRLIVPPSPCNHPPATCRPLLLPHRQSRSHHNMISTRGRTDVWGRSWRYPTSSSTTRSVARLCGARWSVENLQLWRATRWRYDGR